MGPNLTPQSGFNDGSDAPGSILQETTSPTSILAALCLARQNTVAAGDGLGGHGLVWPGPMKTG